jgi:hypothetical protein
MFDMIVEFDFVSPANAKHAPINAGGRIVEDLTVEKHLPRRVPRIVFHK